MFIHIIFLNINTDNELLIHLFPISKLLTIYDDLLLLLFQKKKYFLP